MFARGRALLASYWTPAGKQALGNLIGLVVCSIVSQGSGFGVLLLLTHHLDTAGFSSVSVGLSAQMFLVLFGSLGVSSVVVPILAGHPERRDEMTSAYFTATALGGMTAAAIGLILTCAIPDATAERWLFALLAVAVLPLVLNLAPLFDAAHLQARGAVIQPAYDALMLTVVWLLARSGLLTLPAIGLAFAGKAYLVLLSQMIVFHRTVRPLRRVLALEAAVRLAARGAPMMLAVFAILVPLNAGVLFVRKYGGDQEAGVYGAALQFANAYFLVGSLCIRIIQPHIAGPYGLQAGFVVKVVAFVFSAVGGAGILIGLGGWAVIRGLFPEGYCPSILLLPILLGTVFFMYIRSVAHHYLIQVHRERVLLVIHGLAAVAFAVGCCIVDGTAAAVAWVGFTVVTLTTGTDLFVAVVAVRNAVQERAVGD
jgi:O-antigen/teichoic acid export membrane protein